MRPGSRRPVLLWCMLISVALHAIFVPLLAAMALRGRLHAHATRQPEELIAMSSAVRLEKRTHPKKAEAPQNRPVSRSRKPAQVRRTQPIHRLAVQLPQRAVAPLPRPTATTAAAKPAPSQAPAESPEQAQTRAFEQTIAAARVANNPLAGAANQNARPASVHHYRLNIEGTVSEPQPEGILYPLKRWIGGGYVYYYVHYVVQYTDGSTESGDVPWPIRFPLAADPFAHGQRRMPLPGPPRNYVAGSDLSMSPLVKNCYDHRYSTCPIAHE